MQRKHTHALSHTHTNTEGRGDKATLRILPSETDEDGQQRLAEVAIVKQKKHTRAWRPGEKAARRNPHSETDEDGPQRLPQVAIIKQKYKIK